MSPFDPATFMNQTIDAPLPTQVKQPPEGEYLAMIDDFDEKAFRSVTIKKPDSPRFGQDIPIFRCPFVLQPDSRLADLGREKVVVGKDYWLDIDPATGALKVDDQSNIDLGRLRKALGQNTSGPWSLNNLKGAGPVRVIVKHRSDENDPERKFAEVTAVAPPK
jgi:hypothetical protein